MPRTTFLVLALAVLAALGASASARPLAANDRWPDPLTSASPPPTASAEDRLVEVGNRYLAAFDTLSHRTVSVSLDPRGTARVGLDVGRTRSAALNVAVTIRKVTSIAVRMPPRFKPEPGRERELIEDADSAARLSTRVALAIAGRSVELPLPALEVATQEYRGARAIELRLPLVRRDF